MPATNCSAYSALISELRNTYGLSYEQIADLPPFRGIPASTIYNVYKGNRDWPNKYRRQLGLPRLVKIEETMVRKNAPAGTGRKRPPRIAIRKDDPASAAASLLNNFETQTLKQVMMILEERMKDGRD